MAVLDDVTKAMFWAAKNMDSTRPCLDASGYAHRIADADIYDSHNYTQDPHDFGVQVGGLATDKPFVNVYRDGQDMNIPYGGQPYFVSEFGGIRWNPATDVLGATSSWGYGNTPKTMEDFYNRFTGLCDVLLDNPRMFGYCYTQLTDVFQEQNGILTFDRRPKFDMAKLHGIQARKAAIE